MLDTPFFRACEDAAGRFDVPALAVGSLTEAGRTTFALGCAPDARFRIASVTKPLTASLVVQVADLDAATGVWPDEVRVRHLLSHLSGYECEHGDLARFGDGDDALERLGAELPTLRQLVGVDEIWSYANSGYWLAGLLAARAAGTSFEEALRARVIEPAGMQATDFGTPDVPGTGRGATDEPYPRARRPSGGLVSTVEDLLSFASWQLAEPWTDQLRRPYGQTVSGTYGLGFAGEQVGGREVWGHSGSYGGFQSSLLLAPELGAAFAGLTSSGSGKRALRIVEDRWLERAVGAPRARPDGVVLPDPALAAFTGRYANAESEVDVTAAGGELRIDAFDVATGELLKLQARPIGPQTFEVTGGELEGDRLDFPRDGLARFGGRLALRVA